ncbi:MAG TPA: proteasome accessory factor PafA2 family protein, partial [Acidimicrobiia bacterium]|nr:proteasome accessory factor PafA2 family protein [Acidimicrobiia bacterium]
MAVPKVCGIETEYGVVLRGAADPNPVLASSVLINGYVEHHRVGWDFEDESPGVDARGMARPDAQAPEIETHLVNTVLTNGARYYVDHAHPEYSTPECVDALELTLADKAGERILARSMLAARSLLEPGQEVVVYKNNSDGKGNSYGTHENYLVDRALPFAVLVRHLLPWFVTRQVFTGAGKVGSENGAAAVDYQISQRADFFEEEVGLETTLKRPIVNTRDEPHADPQLYRRLHVIAGDANLCEVATFLKIGTTAIILAMAEDEFFESGAASGGRKDFSISGPVGAMRVVSHDPTCRATVELADGSRLTAVELQWEYLRLAQKYADETGLVACGGSEVGGAVLARWEAVLGALERDPRAL